MIPVLDIKTLESVDSLTFSIILYDECLLNNYNEQQVQEKQNITNKAKNRASMMLKKSTFGLFSAGEADDDGGFPMAFESEHVPQIVQNFKKIQ